MFDGNDHNPNDAKKSRRYQFIASVALTFIGGRAMRIKKRRDPTEGPRDV
jgi:hypothetical protein